MLFFPFVKHSLSFYIISLLLEDCKVARFLGAGGVCVHVGVYEWGCAFAHTCYPCTSELRRVEGQCGLQSKLLP